MIFDLIILLIFGIIITVLFHKVIKKSWLYYILNLPFLLVSLIFNHYDVDADIQSITIKTFLVIYTLILFLFYEKKNKDSSPHPS